MLHQYRAPTQVTRALRRYRERRMRLRTITGGIDHIHQESLALKIRDHSDMLSAQYLVNCLEDDYVCHVITIQETRPTPMKGTLRCSHHSTHGKQERKPPEIAHTRGRIGHSAPRKQQSTERRPTTKSERGAETDPETIMYSLTTTIRTLPSTAGLQAQGVQQTK